MWGSGVIWIVAIIKCKGLKWPNYSVWVTSMLKERQENREYH